jgi:hypothetical protein
MGSSQQNEKKTKKTNIERLKKHHCECNNATYSKSQHWRIKKQPHYESNIATYEKKKIKWS